MLCGSPPMKASISFLEFGTMFGHKNANSGESSNISLRSLPFKSSSKIVGIIALAMGSIKEENEEWICFLGGSSSSGTKKYRGSNSSDGGITGRWKSNSWVGLIRSGYEIEFSKELKELLPNEAGKESDKTEV
ncbi:hypothetical protein Tco_0139361 [Tanacetum coccineum]